MCDTISKWERDARDMASAQRQAFNLRQEIESLRSELLRVTAERDALMADRGTGALAA